MPIEIPDNVRTALTILGDSGFEAYAVGGCVRDSLLGRQPNDWDICTSALPEETRRCFADYRTVPTGIKHGTVTVIINSPLEITTYRIDGDYRDHRRPETVEFTRSLAQDLARRDFTVNSMAVGLDGRVVDIYSGKEDLCKKIIRCVGEPEQRFDEDALRIMRALRFSATLGFEIEEKTAMAIHRQKPLLSRIAAERIHAELNLLLCGRCERVLADFEDVFGVILPEALPITAEKVASVTRAEHLAVKLATLLASGDAQSAMSRLRYDKATSSAVLCLTQHTGDAIVPEKPCIKHLLNQIGKYNLPLLLEHHAVCGKMTGRQADECKALLCKILEGNECYTLSALAVNGRDIYEMHIVPDTSVGRVLGFLLNAVIDEKVCNSKELLLQYALREFKY